MSQVTRGSATKSIVFQMVSQFLYIIPPVYRYLPEEFVDAFFANGEIMLSSFSQFQKHNDEARFDGTEGSAMVSSIGGGREFGAFLTDNNQSYVLCGSLLLSKNIMDQFSGTSAAIEITNVPDFFSAISKQLPGFAGGVCGNCIYGGKILVRTTDKDPFPLPKDPNLGVSLAEIAEAVDYASANEHFLLKEKKYAPQMEHRLIWNVDNKINNSIVIRSKEAMQYCRKVNPAEIT